VPIRPHSKKALTKNCETLTFYIRISPDGAEVDAYASLREDPDDPPQSVNREQLPATTTIFMSSSCSGANKLYGLSEYIYIYIVFVALRPDSVSWPPRRGRSDHTPWTHTHSVGLLWTSD